jgi:hypothetical protein
MTDGGSRRTPPARQAVITVTSATIRIDLGPELRHRRDDGMAGVYSTMYAGVISCSGSRDRIADTEDKLQLVTITITGAAGGSRQRGGSARHLRRHARRW